MYKHDLTVSMLNTLQYFLLHWLRTEPCNMPRPAWVWHLLARQPHGSHTAPPNQNVLFSIPLTAAAPISPHTRVLLAAGMRFLPLGDASSIRPQCFTDKVPDYTALQMPSCTGSHAPFNSAAYAGHLQLQLSEDLLTATRICSDPPLTPATNS